ncbi:MAG TPA: GH116 family glycosyl hydrolase [Longimicrobiales bacterium]
MRAIAVAAALAPAGAAAQAPRGMQGAEAARAPRTTPRGVPRFPIEDGPLALHGRAHPGAYVAEVGRRAALLGDEGGIFEAWVWPLQLVRDLRLAFRIPEYDEPIAGERVMRSVTVRPEALTLTYAHASFTVKQHVFVPLDEPGALMLLEVETVRPLDVLVRMRADFDQAWSGALGGGSIAWLDRERRFLLYQGGARHYHGLIGSPFAVDGTSPPVHDGSTTPAQFTLRFGAGQATADFVPIVIAGGAAPRDSIAAVYDRLLADASRYYAEKLEHYRDVRRGLLAIATPDDRLNLAFEWAKVNLDQPFVCDPELGCGLVAGFGPAGPGGFRPGFDRYSGGDMAISSLGMDALGRFGLVREGLEFLARYQRGDGRIPHEISHAAARLPSFHDDPYARFHGDATPFWVLACYEYWKASGDAAFLRDRWPSIVRAYRWSAATDRDGDGLVENPLAGAGAVRVRGLDAEPHTDIHLAAIWVAALEGVREMARAMGDDALADEADALFERASRSIDDGFWLDPAGIYAFAPLRGGGAAGVAGTVTGAGAARTAPPGGTTAAGATATGRGVRPDDALTVWPSTALAFRLLDARRGARMLRELSSSAITTDWGTRMLSRDHPRYDPLHYDNGAVWPFMTGFAALAHFRYHRPWAGFDLVRDVARTTFDFARGRHPEPLSGAFYQVLDTTVPQRFLAASMLVNPLVRGLLGLEADAPNHAVAIEPHLPAHWDTMSVENFRVGTDRLDVSIRREGEIYALGVRRTTDPARKAGVAAPLAARIAPALPLGARVVRVTVNGRDAAVHVEETASDVHPVVELELEDEALVEIEFRGGVEVVPPPERLRLGQPSRGLRILDFRRDGRDYVLLLEGAAGRSYPLELRTAARLRRLRGATLVGQDGRTAALAVDFPAGRGYIRKQVRFRGP